VFESIRSSQTAQIILFVAVFVALIGIGIYVLIRVRRNPKDKEKRRRLAVNESGRLGDATITEVEGNNVFYEYSVRGVVYTASQEVTQLLDRLPTEPGRLYGPASIKYTTNNPANSIIICEEWSGVRAPAKS
jgi:hypothetical protein